MFFLPYILIIGLLTTFTDLKNKKIYNQHLGLGAIVGLIAIAYAAVLTHEHVFFHFVNGLVSFLIGLILHRSSVWRGGDAKLFTLYAFLMPIRHTAICFSPMSLACLPVLLSQAHSFSSLFLSKTSSSITRPLPTTCFRRKSAKPCSRESQNNLFYSWVFFPILLSCKDHKSCYYSNDHLPLF